MNPLKTLLLLIACAGVTGSAPATEQPRTPGTLSPAVAARVHLAHVADPGGGTLAGAGTLLTLPDADGLINGAWSELKIAFNSGDGSARTTKNAGTAPREGTLSAAAAREPSEWLELLCGLAFAAFMVRRRAQLPAD